MLSKDDVNKIKHDAESKMRHALDRLNPSDSSENLASVIAKAIAEAIAEYDRLRSQ
jgi:hypothetical protein